MKTKIISTLMLLVAMAMMPYDAAAQSKKKTKKRKTRTTKVTKKKTVQKVEIVPLDSIVGRVYGGVVGKTVTDFFGTRKTYGDVTQRIYVSPSGSITLQQHGGDDTRFEVKAYTYDGKNTLTTEGRTYVASNGGKTLTLQKYTEGDNEARQGDMQLQAADGMAQTLLARGKYLDGMTEQTEEEKQQALQLITTAKEMNNSEAADYLTAYYKKRADLGQKEAIVHMLRHETTNANYSAAHTYVDKLIDMEPDNADWLKEKLSLYKAQGSKSGVKKMNKKLAKLKKK